MDHFDEHQRFVLDDFSRARPFASFLPGIAGPDGIPLWAFYVNRGQALAAFGVESKDHPILEFQPANKAYQNVAFTGFRTFVKLRRGGGRVYEPFSPLGDEHAERHLHIGMNELELAETAPLPRLQTTVRYFILPGEPFAALVRQVTIRNLGGRRLSGELLDGLPALMPYGVNNTLLKEIGRTAEAWMSVFNLENDLPFYRLHASIADSTEVEEFRAGNFALAFVRDGQRLAAVVDPGRVFGNDSSLSFPRGFQQSSLAGLLAGSQVTTGRTPCAFFGTAFSLRPGEALTLSALYGYVRSVEGINTQAERLCQAAYLQSKRDAAVELALALSGPVATHSADPLFDAYCRQNFLDNVLRGGWPVILGNALHPVVYHLYSRKHGDLERDYNAFFLAAEFYSQGNGNYRDVNQNRRCDVFFEPRIGDFNLSTFLGLIQADGYNPLVIRGSRFSLPAGRVAPLLALAEDPAALADLLKAPFTPGGLLTSLAERGIRLAVPPEEFLNQVVAVADMHFEAEPGEGYWVDHWVYNLDLLESYLAIYPDCQEELFFGGAGLPFYDNPYGVQPRSEKYVLVEGKVRQFEAVVEDKKKAALIAARSELPHLARAAYGQGDVVRVSLFAKLVLLAALKFASFDPWGLGIEMEAGKPGWYDALNGLPGLLASSMPESYALDRLLGILRKAVAATGRRSVDLPLEAHNLLTWVAGHLDAWRVSGHPRRDQNYWEAVSTEREAYRATVRLGFDGRCQPMHFDELEKILAAFQGKIQAGHERARGLNGGLPPTYFMFDVEEYEPELDTAGKPRYDGRGRPLVSAKRFRPQALPLFLEGLVYALKAQPNVDAARALYRQVKASPLFDGRLEMYKVNASLAGQPAAIGRARAFPPGWLENESIWLHMEYKYLLEVLRAGLYDEFFEDMRHAMPPFLDPQRYGRSPLENSSFLASSAHPDESLHGAGFVARLSGSTAEFLSIWQHLMTGPRPFVLENGRLILRFRPVLPDWLFDADGLLAFRFLGRCTVTYHNPGRRATFEMGAPTRIEVTLGETWSAEFQGDTIPAPYAARVREGEAQRIEVYW